MTNENVWIKTTDGVVRFSAILNLFVYGNVPGDWRIRAVTNAHCVTLAMGDGFSTREEAEAALVELLQSASEEGQSGKVLEYDSED